MRYTIESLQQDYLCELKLKSTDTIILRYLIDFTHSSKMIYRLVDGRIFFWINHNAEKYESTLPDVIFALNKCNEKNRPGEMDYFTGILRKKASARGISGYGKPDQFKITEYLKLRLNSHQEYISNYDLSWQERVLYYSTHSRADNEPVADIMRIVTGEIKKEFNIELKYKLRL